MYSLSYYQCDNCYAESKKELWSARPREAKLEAWQQKAVSFLKQLTKTMKDDLEGRGSIDWTYESEVGKQELEAEIKQEIEGLAQLIKQAEGE